MSVYEIEKINGLYQAFKQTETHLYGSSRIGMVTERSEPAIKDPSFATGFGTATLSTFTRNEKLFELANHLGNVLVTVSDKKKAVDSDNDGDIDYYEADVVTATDYYPGGMDMPGRQFNATTGYRYGFNGKEKDNKDGIVQYDYGFRIYDPRLVRFKSVDPLANHYPGWTPYAYAMGDVIRSVDLDGLEKKIVVHWLDGVYGDGTPKIIKTAVDIDRETKFIEIYISSRQPTGKEFAHTETYFALPDGRFIQAETLREEIVSGGLKPSANYDYTQRGIPGKASDDWAYIRDHFTDELDAGSNGLMLWIDLLRRDARAPDNASTLEDMGGLNAAAAVVGVPIRVGTMTARWVEESTAGWSSFSKAYQRQIAGQEGKALMMNGVKFDGFAKGALLDAKGKYSFLLEKGWAQEGLLKQAQSQIKAANGAKIEWHFAEKEASDAVKTLFENRGIKGIDVFHTPSITP